jgi:hypothetical protein
MPADGRRLDAEIEELCARPAAEGCSLAFMVVQRGELIAERYGTVPPNVFQASPQPVGPTHRSCRGARRSR